MAGPRTLPQLIANLPRELLFEVINQWISKPNLKITLSYSIGAGLTRLSIECGCPIPVHLFPPFLQQEYERLLNITFLTMKKHFTSPLVLCVLHMVVLLCDVFAANPALVPLANIITRARNRGEMPWVFQPLRPTGLVAKSWLHDLTGLEQISLNFTAKQYFAFFNVGVEPFTRDRWSYIFDAPYIRAAKYLLETQDLEVEFGATFFSLNPWEDLVARTRDTLDDHTQLLMKFWIPCAFGKVIDYILTAAWVHGYIRHIQRIVLRGNLQPWVREKWESIFRRRKIEGDEVALEYGVPESFGNIAARGLTTPVPSAQRPPISWRHLYAPSCECPVSCHNLGRGDAKCNNY